MPVSPRWGWPIGWFQTQGGARSSLALGWLAAGRWPGGQKAHHSPAPSREVELPPKKRVTKYLTSSREEKAFEKPLSPRPLPANIRVV